MVSRGYQAPISGSQLTVLQNCSNGCSSIAPICGSGSDAPEQGSKVRRVDRFDEGGTVAPMGGSGEDHVVRRRLRGKTHVGGLACWSPWVHSGLVDNSVVLGSLPLEEEEVRRETPKRSQKRHMLRLRANALRVP